MINDDIIPILDLTEIAKVGRFADELRSLERRFGCSAVLYPGILLKGPKGDYRLDRDANGDLTLHIVIGEEKAILAPTPEPTGPQPRSAR